MGSMHSTNRIERVSSVDTLTDEEILRLIDDKCNSIPRAANGFPSNTMRTTHDTFSKMTMSPTEAFMMNYVSSLTSIPIPKIRRVVSISPNSSMKWIVMDYIEGETLHSAWPKMSWWRRFYALWTIRNYVQQLRNIPIPNHDIPGPFDDSGTSYECLGNYFTEYGAGPFTSYSDMASWFDRRRWNVLAAHHDMRGFVDPQLYPKFDKSHPLVLCHMDLHMGNVMVDSASGKIWLVDWAGAGAYPAWLEYAHMILKHPLMYPTGLWTFSARFIVGNYRRYVEYLEKYEWAWCRPAWHDYFPTDYFTKLEISVD